MKPKNGKNHKKTRLPEFVMVPTKYFLELESRVKELEKRLQDVEECSNVALVALKRIA